MNTRRLISIDALRGLAALGVVLSHVAEPGGGVRSEGVGSAVDRAVAGLLGHGRVGVVLFFVISGFCIHLRRAKASAGGESPPLDFTSFWKRRFLRLYPPYFVALLLYLGVQTRSGEIGWDRFDVYDLFAHLTMLHNLDARTVFSIEGVFWTLAIEEQLYLAYFVLLPLRDRLGWTRTLAVCAGARAAWFALAFAVGHWGGGEFRLSHDSGSPSHWFSWALGAVCVESALGVVTLPAWASRWKFAGFFFAAAAGCDLATGRHLGGGMAWRLTWLVGSPLWGLGFFVVVNRLIRAEAGWRSVGVIPRAVSTFAGLGLFSYSLYLTHNLVLKHFGPTILGRLGLADDLAGRLLLVGPALGLAWAFFLGCEQPFLDRATRRTSRLDPASKGVIPTPR